jgi:EmrB/QacA subfamily drug resistance transporter
MANAKGSAHAGHRRVREGWVIATTVLGSSIAFVDTTVVNVALPVIQRQLHASADEAQWVVEAFALVLAGCILIGGALGDRSGRRRMYVAGTVIFAAASVACGLANGVSWLIAARVVQGIGAAMLIPGSLAILGACFEGRARARAIGMWSACTALAPAAGPVVGGWLVQHVSWRWVFFINPPLAVIVIIMAYAYVPESRAESRGRLDWPGSIVATLGLAGLVAGALEVQRLGAHNPLVVGALIGGALLLGAFVYVEAHSKAPMVPLSLFGDRVFTAANVFTLFLYAALSGALYFVPFNLIQVQHYSPTAAGAAIVPSTILLFLISQTAERLMERYGARTLLTVGPAIVGVAFALFARPFIGGSYWTTYFPASVALGVGLGLTVAPLTTSVMNAVPAANVGAASGVNNAVSRTAGVLGLAVMALIAGHVFGTSLDARVSELRLPPAAAQQLAREHIDLAAAAVPRDLDPARAHEVQRAVDESFVRSFRILMLAGTLLALASALIGWFAVRRKDK